MVLPEPKHPHLCETACLPQEGSTKLGLNSLEDVCYRSIVDAIFKALTLICTFRKISLRN